LVEDFQVVGAIPKSSINNKSKKILKR